MKSWSLREKFIEILTQCLNAKQRQVAWYEGSQERYDNFIREFPDALRLGKTDYPTETQPWVFVPNLTPDQANTQRENWCGVLQEVCLPGDHPSDFLSFATEFCNEKCWGSLTCCLIIDPHTQSAHNSAFQSTLEALKYGNITINAPPIFNFLPAASWGAFPGNEMWNIGSGNCTVHNTSLFDYPEKSVMYCPWILQPVPTWTDVTNKTALIKAVLNFIQKPNILTLLGIVLPLLRASV